MKRNIIDSEEELRHKRMRVELQCRYNDLHQFFHQMKLQDVLEQLIRCTQRVQPIAQAQRDVQIIDLTADDLEEEITWWELTADQMLWVETVEMLHDILQ